MIVKNLTPFVHATKVTARRPPQADMTLVVRGTFRLVNGGVVEAIEGLEQGFLSGETFAEEDSERAGASLYPGDLADFKLNAEVMLRGTCHAPRGRSVLECPVRLAVGSWKKDLVVFGNRRWKGLAGNEIGEPSGFERMPLDMAHAYGGPSSPRNPVGRGRDVDLLPNVELPGRRLTSRGQDLPPASYAPIASTWAERAAKVGKNYGDDYLARRAPFYADDFDWTHFHAAPSDQQLTGYLRGDEEVALHNLHPEHAVLTTRLPGLRVRAFVRGADGEVREVSMVLDTLFVEPDDGVLKLTWRGLTPVREEDLSDVRTALIVAEPLDGPHESLAHHAAALAAFEADPTGVLAGLPPELRQAWEDREKKRRGEHVEPPQLDPSLDPLSRELASSFGPLLSAERLGEVRAQVAKLEAPLPEGAPPQARVDLAQVAAAAKSEAADVPPPMRTRKPGSLPGLDLRRKMRVVIEQVATIRAREKDIGRPVEGLAELEAIPHDPRWKRLDPTYEVPGPLSSDAPGPGADLRERDLRGADLRGVDLRGANLEDADLSHANLYGVCLAGAKLGRAMLYKANLEHADLREADLRLAHCGAVRAAQAEFGKAVLEETFFEGADLREAKLDGARGSYAIFADAVLEGARAEGATFDQADFTRARLARCSLRRASAKLAIFSDASLEGADLEDAAVEQSTFGNARCQGARLVGLRGVKAYFDHADLTAAELAHADLRDAHLTAAKLVDARAFGANLRGARLDRADLRGAQLVSTNLMQADLSKAKVERTNLTRASLYEASLRGVKGAGLDLTEAKLDRVVRDPS